MGVVATLVVRVVGDVSPLVKELGGLERTMARTGDKFKAIGRDLTVGLTAPIVAIGGLSVKAAMEFESSFAGVRKTVDGVVGKGGELTAFGKQLEQGFRDLAKEIPISVNELNRIGESAGQLGIKSESILEFTKTIAAMSVSTNLSAEQAADGMARFANITQMPQENISNLGSVIVELGNKLAATESEILDFGLRIAGAGEIVGLTEPQIMGIAAAFSSVGIEAEAGGTAVQKALLAMNSAVTTGKGLEAFGGAAFAKQFQQSPGDAFVGFIDQIAAAGKGGEQVLRNAGIDDARQIRAFLSIAAAGDVLRNSLKLAGDEWGRNTALAREAEQRYRTFESQLKLFKNALYDIGITVGRELIESFLRMKPAIENVLEGLSGAVRWFSELPESVQTAAFAFSGFLAALGPLSYLFGTLMTTGSGFVGLLKQIMKWIVPVGGAATAATGTAAGTGVAGLWAALVPFAVPTAIVAGLVAIAAAIYKITQAANSGGPATLTDLRSRMGLPALNGKATDVALPAEGWVTGDGIGTLLETTNQLPMAFNLAGGSAEGAKAKVSEFDRAVQSLTDRLGGGNVVESANQWVMAIDRIGGIGKLTKEELASFTEEVSKAVEKLTALGEEVPRTWQVIANSVENAKLLQASRDFAGEAFRGFKENRQIVNGAQLRNEGGEFAAGLIGGPAGLSSQGVTAEAMAYGQTMARRFSAGWQTGLSELPGVILGALQGGGSVVASVSSLLGGTFASQFSQTVGQKLSGLLGNTLGQSIGSIMGPLGAALGPLIGNLIGGLGQKIWGGLQSMFGTDEEAKLVNPARDAFLAQFGGAGTGAGSGFGELAAKLTGITGEEGGGSLFQALIGADSMEAFEAARMKIQEVLTQTTDGATSATMATDGLNLALSGSDEAITALGMTQERVVATMLAGFDSLIAKLGEFISAMSAASGLAMPDVPGVPAAPALEGVAPLEDVPSFANEGVVTSPTLAMIGDAPEPEFVLRRSTVAAIAAGGGRGGSLVININGNVIGSAGDIKAWIAEGALEGIRRGGKNFADFQHLVGEATPA